MNKDIFQLKIIYSDAGNKTDGMPYRIIQYHKDTNLQQLAASILKNFGFKMAEPFGFYSEFDNWHKSKHKFELFEDDPKKNTIKNTYLDDLFDIQADYLFIYDYLEEFRFIIKLEKTVPERPGLTYPDLIESIGEKQMKSTSSFAEEEEGEVKYAIKKDTGGFKDEFDDGADEDTKNLDSIEGESDDEDDTPTDEDEDELGFDELSEGNVEDDYK
ncbi:MAG: hypothetical protein NW207_08505 [Cytophagales bacterium]|nr:hypothetical protein [Cytophagales bacterium]